MEPDRYEMKNPAEARTALAVWMQFGKRSRASVAKSAGVAEATVGKAMAGEKINAGSATAIAMAVHMDVDIIRAGELRHAWEFELNVSGQVCVGGVS